MYVCSQRACYNGPQFPDSPTPARNKRDDVEATKPGCDKGQTYYDGCNHCNCVDNKFYVCTERACYHGPLFPDTVTVKETIVETTGSPRSRREVQESTGKYDPPRQNQLPFLRFDVERCTPYEVKNQVSRTIYNKSNFIENFQECNRCKCTNNGKGWLCTRKACPAVAATDDQTRSFLTYQFGYFAYKCRDYRAEDYVG